MRSLLVAVIVSSFFAIITTAVYAQPPCQSGSWGGTVDVTNPDARNFISGGLRIYPGETVEFSLSPPDQTANINQSTGRRRKKPDVASCISGCPWKDYPIPNVTGVSETFPLEFWLYTTTGREKKIGPEKLTMGSANVMLGIPFPEDANDLAAILQPNEPRAWIPTAVKTPCPAHDCSSGAFFVCAMVKSDDRAKGIGLLLGKRKLSFADFQSPDLLNSNLRENLPHDEKLQRNLVSGVLEQVSKFHKNSAGRPEGNDALQYLQYGLSVDKRNRDVQNLLLQYYLNLSDFSKIAEITISRFNEARDELLSEKAPKEWERYSDFIQDGVIIGGALVLNRPLARQLDLIEAASFFRTALAAYDNFLNKNPSAYSETDHRRRYTYLALLLSQTLYTAGGIDQLNEGVTILNKPIQFYAEQLPGSLLGFDLKQKVALLRVKINEKINEGSEQRTSLVALSLPLDAAWASPAQVLAIKDTENKLGCVVNDFAAIAASEPTSEPTLLLICDKDRLLTLTSNGQIKENKLEISKGLFGLGNLGRPRLIPAGAGRTIVAVVDDEMSVNRAWVVDSNGNREPYEPTIDGTKVELSNGGWRLAQVRAGGGSMSIEDVAFWKSKSTREGALLHILDPTRENALTVISVVGVDSNTSPVALLRTRIGNTEELVAIVPKHSDRTWRLFASTGAFGKIPRNSDEEVLIVVNDSLILAVSPKNKEDKTAVDLRAYSVFDGQLEDLDCPDCMNLTLADVSQNEKVDMADLPIAATWLDSHGNLAVGTFTGVQVISLQKGKRSIPASVSGPRGQPVAISMGATAGFVFGALNPNEVSTWRFTLSGGD